MHRRPDIFQRQLVQENIVDNPAESPCLTNGQDPCQKTAEIETTNGAGIDVCQGELEATVHALIIVKKQERDFRPPLSIGETRGLSKPVTSCR